MFDNKISVICASFLGQYEGAASNREDKFIRAINTFINQTHKNSELIIVSDGCDKTDLLYKVYFEKHENIRHFRIPKQSLFSGMVRQKGIEEAKGNLICYLDGDDMMGRNHLSNINCNFPKGNDYDWVYYNDFYYASPTEIIPKVVSLEKGSIGTPSIAHLTSLRERGLSWKGCDKYNHDWLLVQRLMKFPRYKKIYGCSYYMCHIPNQLDA